MPPIVICGNYFCKKNDYGWIEADNGQSVFHNYVILNQVSVPP
jgi:hypothetical protein